MAIGFRDWVVSLDNLKVVLDEYRKGLLIVITIVGLASAFIIWIVSKLHLGLEVKGFGSAFLAAVIIVVLAVIFNWLLSIAGVQDESGLIGGIVHLISSVIILMISTRILQGLKVKGILGALVAAIAIGIFYWLGEMVLGFLVN